MPPVRPPMTLPCSAFGKVPLCQALSFFDVVGSSSMEPLRQILLVRVRVFFTMRSDALNASFSPLNCFVRFCHKRHTRAVFALLSHRSCAAPSCRTTSESALRSSLHTTPSQTRLLVMISAWCSGFRLKCSLSAFVASGVSFDFTRFTNSLRRQQLSHGPEALPGVFLFSLSSTCRLSPQPLSSGHVSDQRLPFAPALSLPASLCSSVVVLQDGFLLYVTHETLLWVDNCVGLSSDTSRPRAA